MGDQRICWTILPLSGSRVECFIWLPIPMPNGVIFSYYWACKACHLIDLWFFLRQIVSIAQSWSPCLFFFGSLMSSTFTLKTIKLCLSKHPHWVFLRKMKLILEITNETFLHLYVVVILWEMTNSESAFNNRYFPYVGPVLQYFYHGPVSIFQLQTAIRVSGRFAV